MTPTLHFKAMKERWKYGYRLLRLLISIDRRSIAINVLLAAANGLLPAAYLIVFTQLVDGLATYARIGEADRGLLIWVVVLAGVMLLQKVAAMYGDLVGDHIQEKIKLHIQEQTVAKAQAIPLAVFEQSEWYNRLQRVQNGIDNRIFSTMAFFFRAINRTITILSLSAYLVAVHWVVSLLIIGGSVVFTLFKVKLLHEKYILERKQTEEERQLNYYGGLMTSRAAAAEIRLFGLKDNLLDGWLSRNNKLKRERLAHERRTFRQELFSSGGLVLVFAVNLLIVVYYMMRNKISIGQYAAILTAIIYMQEELASLFFEILLLDHDMRYLEDFFVFLDLPEEDAGDRRKHELAFVQELAFKQVAFRYPGADQPSVQLLNLTIAPGEKIALVGANGAGKTTLAKLLLGLYHPTEGTITLDGIGQHEATPEAWRSNMTAIFQDFQQYQFTMRENIALSSLADRKDDTRVQQAAERAGLAGLIEAAPGGYDAQLGKEFAGGADLSLGQWQKVALARAYFKNASLIVLDEPTASLDPKAEVEVYKQFQAIAEGKAVLIISHRLGVARLADRILVMQEGQIVEEGTHEVLLKQQGIYAEMFGIQAKWYE